MSSIKVPTVESPHPNACSQGHGYCGASAEPEVRTAVIAYTIRPGICLQVYPPHSHVPENFVFAVHYAPPPVVGLRGVLVDGYAQIVIAAKLRLGVRPRHIIQGTHRLSCFNNCGKLDRGPLTPPLKRHFLQRLPRVKHLNSHTGKVCGVARD